MGRTVLPWTSRRITMGMLVTGSIMRPRIFISTSMAPSQLSLHHSCTFAHQRVGPGAGDAHGQVRAQELVAVGGGMGEVESTVVGGAADPLAERGMPSLDQNFLDGADALGVAADLNQALFFLQDGEAP